MRDGKTKSECILPLGYVKWHEILRKIIEEGKIEERRGFECGKRWDELRNVFQNFV